MNLPENSESAQQRQILDALPSLVFLERAGKIVFANAEARLILGVPDGETIQRPVEEVFWGLSPGAAEAQTIAAGSRRASAFHTTLLAPNGRMLPIEGAFCMVNAEMREAIIVAHPAGRERAPRSRLLEDVLASIPEAVVIVHDRHILYTNPAFTRMFGFSAEEVSGANPLDFIVPETRRFEASMLVQAVDQHGHASLETVRKTKSGELVDVSLVAGPLTINGTRVGYSISYRDIGERKQVEAKLQHDAMHDVLTGLPNRALFLDRLALAFSRRARRRDQNCGVLFLDLDGFKKVNDSLGHAAGDMLLITMAERMRAILRPHDTPARLGGDEFAVLVENIVSTADLETVASRILSELELAYTIYGHSVQVGASIGAAIAGPEHASPEALIRDADYAMYRAKQAGGGRLEVFDRNLEARVVVEHERERELRRMLENRQFDLCYEPIFRLDEGKLAGFESALRLSQPDDATNDLRDLLALAEDTGLSITIGRELTETVCRQIASWKDSVPGLVLGVNLTHRQFYHPQLIAQLAQILDATGAEPSRLLLEVEETTLNDNPDAAVAILQRMVDMNFRIAVDDFGSGMAPVNQLVRLPVDVVKMDRNLTLAVGAPGRQAAVTETVIHLGRLLGVQVVAQGIESAQQLEALRQLGCELGQGVFMGVAVDAREAERLAALSYWTVEPPA